jgi:hypothetical protein
MSGEWPRPRDTEAERLTYILHMYRNALKAVSPQACRDVDGQMWRWGQGWISEEGEIDVNRMMSARQIQEEFGIQSWKVFDWARRHPELLPKFKKDGRVLFRLGDVLTFRGRHKKKNQHS